MTAFPKYPSYKPSGVEWLGDVPEHWEVKKGRYIFTESNQRSLSGAEVHLSMSQRYGLVPADQLTAKSLQSESYEGAKLCYKGDIVLNRLKAHLGVFAVAKQDGVISPDYSVFRLREPDYQPQYFESLFKTPAYLTAFNKAVRGIVVGFYRLYTGDFYDIPFLVPPKSEQDRIVAFLDEKTAEIDRLIAKKQRQIELLDEQKAILINRAVTRGLQPQAELQDSGIPWIGPIPKHWRVVPIKRMASVQNGVTLGPVYPVNMSSEVPYLRVANVQNGSLNLNTVATLRLPRRIASKYLLQSGDVLVAEGGDLDKLGRGCVWRAEIAYCIHQNHVFAVRTEAAKLLPEFLSTALGSRYGQRYFMLTGKQTTNLASTNSTSLMNFPLATPSLEEQKQIMEELVRTLTAFERARNAITSQIQTLQTLRSTLIAHAVTGKIAIPATTA